MKKYYGFEHFYGIATVDDDGCYIGDLIAFNSKKERDEWVDKDLFKNGNFHRSSLTSKEARKWLIHNFDMICNYLGEWCDVYSHEIPMNVLVEAYEKAIVDEEWR